MITSTYLLIPDIKKPRSNSGRTGITSRYPAFGAGGNLLRLDRQPLDLEEPVATEYLSEDSITDINFNPEFLFGIVVPLTHVGNGREDHRKSEADDSLVETLIRAGRIRTWRENSLRY